MTKEMTKVKALAFKAVVQGLQVAITAPSDALANQATEMVESIAREHLTLEELELAKDAAVSELQS
jgi:RecG-like helicase|tara:strand:+ start:387 stop:584 length:198 start_codon:yes stop_codon:yes gene_type:complete